MAVGCNHPEVLDIALFRRFDDVVEYHLQEQGASVPELLHRHLTGDWQEMCKPDRDANWAAVLEGEARVFSSFDIAPKGHAGKPIKIWVITEWDRSVTTILRPEDY